MIPLPQNQIIISLLLIFLHHCRADNDTYLDISGIQVGEIKSSSYMQNNDLVNMKVLVINATAVKFQITFADKQLPNYRSRPRLSDPIEEIQVNVTAQILYSPLTKYHSTLLCQLKERVVMEQKSVISHEMCRSELFAFRAFNSESKNFEVQLSHICDSRKESHMLGVEGGKVIVSGLLPSQTYMFNITFSSLVNNVLTPLETKVEYICMPPGAPQFAPQTDLASYSLAPAKDEKNDLELISLYWRPLPSILVGGSDSRYNIYCEDDLHKNTHNITVTQMEEGNISFYKPKDKSLICKLRSSDSKHYGAGYSPIVVPDGNHRINLTDKFRFYAYAVSNEEYMFEWTPIEVDPENKTVLIHNSKVNKTNPKITDGYFTIYWCIPGRAAGCSSLQGLFYPNTTPTYFVFPSRTELTPRMFGISYTHYSPPMSTGIIWSECESTFGHQFINEQLRIIKAAPPETDHTSLSISWTFPGCDAQAAAIDLYEINYCKVSQLTGCSSMWSNHMGFNLSHFQFESSSDHQCKTLSTFREFQESAIIHDLSPASNYVIRIRYVLGNGTTNAWSEPRSATTLPDPQITDDCKRTYVFSFLIISAMLIGLLIFLTLKTPKWLSHFKLMRSKFKKTTEGICNFVTDMNAEEDLNDVIFKYCANTGRDELIRSKSELSLGFLSYEESVRSSLNDPTSQKGHNSRSDYNHMNQIFDYIPKSLVEGAAQDITHVTSGYNTGDMIRFELSSEQDEISLSSQPLIWESGSNYEMDFNNNQTDTSLKDSSL